MSFLDDFRAALDASGRSRAALAEELGIAESTVSRVLGGHQDPALSTIERLLGAVGARLAVVPVDAERELPPTLPLTDAELMGVALVRLETAGARAPRGQLATVIGRDAAAVTRALAGGALSAEARARLLAHLASGAEEKSTGRSNGALARR